MSRHHGLEGTPREPIAGGMIQNQLHAGMLRENAEGATRNASKKDQKRAEYDELGRPMNPLRRAWKWFVKRVRGY